MNTIGLSLCLRTQIPKEAVCVIPVRCAKGIELDVMTFGCFVKLIYAVFIRERSSDGFVWTVVRRLFLDCRNVKPHRLTARRFARRLRFFMWTRVDPTARSRESLGVWGCRMCRATKSGGGCKSWGADVRTLLRSAKA